jgi:predicted histone-like DNA-binding protein
MAIKVKAVERKLKFTKNENDPGVYRYVLGAELYTALNQKKVIREAALRSGVSQGVMQACWDAAGEVIKAWATEGHSVALPGLGTMRFGVRAKAVEKVEDVKSGLISARRIIFTPNSDLKEELKATAIQITCYDRNGEVVKRVTSDDEGEVEDTEQAPSSDTGSNTSGTGSNTGNTDSNTQGGDNTGGGSTGGDDYHDPDGGTNSDE